VRNLFGVVMLVSSPAACVFTSCGALEQALEGVRQVAQDGGDRVKEALGARDEPVATPSQSSTQTDQPQPTQSAAPARQPTTAGPTAGQGSVSAADSSASPSPEDPLFWIAPESYLERLDWIADNVRAFGELTKFLPPASSSLAPIVAPTHRGRLRVGEPVAPRIDNPQEAGRNYPSTMWGEQQLAVSLSMLGVMAPSATRAHVEQDSSGEPEYASKRARDLFMVEGAYSPRLHPTSRSSLRGSRTKPRRSA
jgi:hypothetical protein